MTQGQRQKLMEAVQSMMSRFKLPSGTLSIHRGSWLSDNTKFHAHICVDVKDYLRIFEQEENIIPDWPNEKYVTPQWKAKKDPSSYPENVRGYPYKSYFDDEVAAIEKLKLSGGLPSVDLPVVGESGINPVFHPREPRIGFVGMTNNVLSVNLVWAIENFAANLGLTNPHLSDENDGCHVCLHFGSVVPTED